MTITIAERSIAEAAVLPDHLSFKTAEDMAGQAVAIDETKGIVTAIVSVTGVVDEVDDIIVPGAYTETLSKRNPKVCWAHSWEHPIGKTLAIEELMPGDKRLPKTTRDGKPWPREAGALVASMQFNLRTDEGKNAFEVVRFYSETGECEYSIGYQVPPGKATKNAQGIRLIKMLELYELSVVLFGAHTMTGTLSIKDALSALNEVKRLGVDFTALGAKQGLPVSRRAGTGELKAPVPPQFQKDDEESAEDGDKPTAKKPTVTERDDLPAHDADTNLTTEDCPCGDLLVFDTANGWQRLDGSYDHDDGTTHSDWLLPPEDAATAPEGEEDAPVGAAAPDEEPPPEGGAPPADDTRPPTIDQPGAEADADGEGEEETTRPDFSDGIMVAVYPDPAAADAVANHIAGPDETTPREELHVTLAYLGKIGESDMSEQQIIDAVTRAVEGQPALNGEIGGIGQFPAGDEGAPTYAPVDVPGLNLLREQIVSELGDVVYNDHGFTPHMTLGYNIGIIDPVPPTPVTFTEVRVVYGNSQRGITLGSPLPEAKGILFTEVDPPAVEVKSGLYWFRTGDATMFRAESGEWKAVDPATAVEEAEGGEPEAVEEKVAYDPALEGRKPSDTLVKMAQRLGILVKADPTAIESKAGGADRNRGEAEELREFWTTGEGGALIGWNTDGDFTRCVALLSEHMTPENAKGYCANRHKEMTGMWPGDDRNTKGADVNAETKGDLAVPAAGKMYPQMAGSFEERQQALRLAIESQYEDEVDEHGHRQVWVDVRSTWQHRVLYTVDDYRSNDTTHYFANYTIDEDGTVDLSEPEEVVLHLVPVPVDDEDDDVPIGDALPFAEDVMAIVAGMKSVMKSVQPDMEGKAGRVLSGANERALRTAFQHLVAVLAAAGIDLGDVTPDDVRPVGNSGDSGGDQRREMDPAVDLGTTSPSGMTKSAEAKGLDGGEILTIDMAEHRRLLAAIEETAAAEA